MRNLTATEEFVLLAMAEGPRFIGDVATITRGGEDAFRELLKLGLVTLQPTGSCVVTDVGAVAARRLVIPKPQGRLAEAAEGIDERLLAVLDAVTERTLAKDDSGLEAGELTKLVQKSHPTFTPELLESIAGTHLHGATRAESEGGVVRQVRAYRVTLRGVLGSLWGGNAVELLGTLLRTLRAFKGGDPTLTGYSWPALMAANGWSEKSLNLVCLVMDRSKLGHGPQKLEELRGVLGWRAPADLEQLLESGADANEYVLRCFAHEP